MDSYEQTVEELFREQEKRVLDAMALRKPDRVLLVFMLGFFPAKYSGMTPEDVMYDPDKLLKASLKILTDFEPDMDQKPFSLRFLGPFLDALDFKQLSGHGLSADHAYQFVEGGYMTADEHDHFLLDPADFMVRNYWPRVFGASKGFAKLPPLHSIISYYLGMPTGFAAFSIPEVARTLALSGKNEREKSLACLDHLLRRTVHVDHKSLRASKEVAKRVEGSLAQPPICKGKPASCAFSEYGLLFRIQEKRNTR